MKCIHENITTLLDTASVLISRLQATLKRIKGLSDPAEEGLLQQYLDEENLYIKQIPHVINLLNI